MSDKYVAQLLPNLAEARFIRDALQYYTRNAPLSEEELDMAYGIVADLYKQMKRNHV